MLSFWFSTSNTARPMAHEDKQNRTIVLNIDEESYSHFITHKSRAHTIIQSQYSLYPELFPAAMAQKYVLLMVVVGFRLSQV